MALAASGTQIGMFDWNVATGETLWTEQAARLLGLSTTTTTTTTTTTLSLPYHYADWAERVHPEDLPRVESEVRRCMSEHTPFEMDYRVVWPDGSVHWVAGRGVFQYDSQDQPQRMLGIVMDITERKRAEEAVAAAQRQVQSIIDNTTAIVYAFDLEEHFLLANTAVAELLNSTPEQMIGKRRHDFMPRDDADWHEANDRQVIEAGRALEFEEYSQLKGRSITWLTTKFPLRDAQGRIYAVAGISADISERKRAPRSRWPVRLDNGHCWWTYRRGSWLRGVSMNCSLPWSMPHGIDRIAVKRFRPRLHRRRVSRWHGLAGRGGGSLPARRNLQGREGWSLLGGASWWPIATTE